MTAGMKRALKSPLAPYIEGLVAAKRACGYSYEGEEYELGRFDELCCERGLEHATIDRDLVMAWAEACPAEGRNRRAQRVSYVRQLCLYMVGQGVECYVPHGFSARRKNVPYIPSAEEVADFFAVADAWEPGAPGFRLMQDGYRVAFRLMYCCGLRTGECAGMRAEDVDPGRGALVVRHSKGDKDRLVYMADDLSSACATYRREVESELGFAPEWLFPGKYGRGHVSKTTYDLKFRQFWAETPAGRSSARRPTPHCLRHAFVVERVNGWIREGVDVGSMAPYLSRYLGHSGPEETFYYYHQVAEAMPIVRERDGVCGRVVPEVS